MNSLLNIYDKLSCLRIKIPRLLDAKKELSMKKAYIPFGKINRDEAVKVNELWHGLAKVNMNYLSLYNYCNQSFDPRYIPDDLYYGAIDPYYNKALDCAALDDKNLYDLYFSDAPQPKTIVRKIRWGIKMQIINLLQ